jgi:hypothetical protein
MAQPSGRSRRSYPSTARKNFARLSSRQIAAAVRVTRVCLELHRSVAQFSSCSRGERSFHRGSYTRRGETMYIGVGTLVVILIIVLIIYFVRRA